MTKKSKFYSLYKKSRVKKKSLINPRRYATMNTADTRGEFTLAHGFPKGSQGANFVGLALNECGKHGIGGEISKMGPHMTVLPPFVADRAQVAFAASCMRADRSLLHVWDVTVTIFGIDFFKTGKGESLYLAIQVPGNYSDHVEWMKATKQFEWVHRPIHDCAVEPLYVPHVHVLEGEGLRGKIKPFENDFNNLFAGRRLALPPARFYEKIIGEEGKHYVPFIP